MKKVLVALVCLFAVHVSAQDQKKWLVGLGVNFIDNTNSEDNDYLDISNWNSTFSVSKLSVQYFYNKEFSIGSEFTLNRFDKDIRQNGGAIDANKSYFAIDIMARYNVGSLIKLPSKIRIEPIAGVGNFWTDSNPNQSFNTGLSLGYQVTEAYGLRFQSVGKFAAEKNTLGNNMIQHSIELVINL